MPDSQSWRIAIDRGGTFTDVVASTPDGRLVTEKLLSENPEHYPDAASEAVRRLMARHGEGPIAEVRIGTTVAVPRKPRGNRHPIDGARRPFPDRANGKRPPAATRSAFVSDRIPQRERI